MHTARSVRVMAVSFGSDLQPKESIVTTLNAVVCPSRMKPGIFNTAVPEMPEVGRVITGVPPMDTS